MVNAGRPEEAIAPLRKAIDIQPAYSTAWENLVDALAKTDRWDEAYRSCQDAIGVVPNNDKVRKLSDWVRLQQGRASAKRKDWSTSRKYLLQALEAGQANSDEGWFELAAVELLANDIPGYQRTCSFMLERCESAGLRRFLVARANTLGPIPAQALTRAADLAVPELDLSAHSDWSLTERGALLCRQGHLEEGIGVLQESIQVSDDPVNAVINWVWLAHAHWKLGHPDEARRWLSKAVDWLDRTDGIPERIHLHNWLEAQVLRREVETTLAP